MNTQSKLTELDRTKLANLQLRQQLLNNEAEQFQRDLFAAYGNPGENLHLGVNGELTRTPVPPPPAEPPRKGRKK